MRKIDAISRHLCRTLFTETFKVDESIKKYTLIENFCMISNRALVRIKVSLHAVSNSLTFRTSWVNLIHSRPIFSTRLSTKLACIVEIDYAWESSQWTSRISSKCWSNNWRIISQKRQNQRRSHEANPKWKLFLSSSWQRWSKNQLSANELFCSMRDKLWGGLPSSRLRSLTQWMVWWTQFPCATTTRSQLQPDEINLIILREINFKSLSEYN